MAVYSGRGITAFLWVCRCVTACDCMCGLIQITHTCPPPPPHCWAATTSPRDTIKSPWPEKQAWAGGRWDETGSPGKFLSLQVSEGSLARRRRPRDVRAVQKRNLSQHSWLTARPEAIPTRSIPLLALHWAVHAHTEGNRKFWSGQRFTAVKVVCVQELLNSQDMATDNFSLL